MSPRPSLFRPADRPGSALFSSNAVHDSDVIRPDGRPLRKNPKLRFWMLKMMSDARLPIAIPTPKATRHGGRLEHSRLFVP